MDTPPPPPVLPEGWNIQYSNTNKRNYYVHSATNRRQWHYPDLDIEADRQAIRSFYGKLADEPSGTRNVWRGFNNFLKQSIMEEFVSDLRVDYMNDCKYSVLDVGCGTGGDLGKWARLEASNYMGFDGSESSIKCLLGRNLQGFQMKVSAFCGDFTTIEAWDRVPAKKFDVVSCQFAAHYAFAEKASARAFMTGIANALSSRGRAIIVTTDAEEWRFKSKRKWGPAIISDCNDTATSFGDRYMFQLDSRVCAPEWWVHKSSFKTEVEAVGLEIAFEANLCSFASWIGVGTARADGWRQIKYESTHQAALLNMYGDESVKADAWALSSLYKIYVLRKPGLQCGNASAQNFSEWLDQ
jgi:SAM-dependent methyltransferase